MPWSNFHLNFTTLPGPAPSPPKLKGQESIANAGDHWKNVKLECKLAVINTLLRSNVKYKFKRWIKPWSLQHLKIDINSQLSYLHHTTTTTLKLIINIYHKEAMSNTVCSNRFNRFLISFRIIAIVRCRWRADYSYSFLDVVSFMVLFISWIDISHYFSKVCWSQQVFILVTFLWVISWLFVYVYVSLYYVIIQILGWSKVMKGIFYGEDFLKFRMYLQQLVLKIPTVV